MLGASLTIHLEQVETFIHGRSEAIPNDYLRFGHNQAPFFLLNLLGDLVWRYRVRELHPRTRLFTFFGRYCVCGREPTRMNLAGLVDHLIDMGPYDQPPTLSTEDETHHHQGKRILKRMSLLGKIRLWIGRMRWGRSPLRKETVTRNLI